MLNAFRRSLVTHHFFMTPERWKHIDKLLEEALEVDANERAALLDQACAGDEALRRKVEDLLAAHERAASFIETPALEATAQALAEQARLMVGRKLGRYQILSLLGAGGMGEVYRARDTHLNREVAIKVLPAHLTQDVVALARFEREAQAVAALSHPNILAIHDFGNEQGLHYAVTELLDGETLRGRLARGALSWREAVEISATVADGLAATHAKGIIHRDLKPENIFLTSDGRVKILDFGLASRKLSGAMSDISSAPTVPNVTEPGMVMGTVGYMSPEQVRGEEVDERSDIFSFGCVLYEMVSGRRAFARETAAETMAAILKDEPPPLFRLIKDTPPELGMITAHCLAKSVKERFQSARDLGLTLKGLLSGSRATATIPVRSTKQVAVPWKWLAAVLVVAAAVAAILSYNRKPPSSGAIHFSISLPGTWMAEGLENHPLAVSPDGQRLAFVLESVGRRMIWVRSRNSVSTAPLAGTEGAVSLFWSPNSKYIGFFADGKLKKIEADGGPPQTLCNVPFGESSGTWSRGGTILFGGRAAFKSALYNVPDAGGEVTLVAQPDRSKGEIAYFWPHFLPDGRHFLHLTFLASLGRYAVLVRSLDTAEPRLLFEVNSRVEYVPPGYLLYVREGTLLAHPFDVGTLEFTGEPVPIAEHVQYFYPTGWTPFSASESLLAYQAGEVASQLVWFDRNGRELGKVGPPGRYEKPRLSPDEKKVAVGMVDPRTGTLDIWTHDLTRGLAARVTSSKPGTAFGPIWSPDSRHLVYASGDGPPHLHRKLSSGIGDEERLLPMREVQWANDWSTDGRSIAYVETAAKTKRDLWILPLADRKPFLFQNTPFDEKEVRFSPDGRWISYVSDESGKDEVYVQPLQKSGEKWTISTDGGSQPVWRRDGKELFYLAADGRLLAVPVKLGASFEAGVPTVLFRIDPAGEQAYDVTADGQRFLVNTNVTRLEALPLTAVINWAATLKR